MKLQFALSGSIIYEGQAECVPPVGASVSFVTQTYKKGMEPGTHVTAVVADDIPPHYDFMDAELVVTLDVDHFEVLKPDPELN